MQQITERGLITVNFCPLAQRRTKNAVIFIFAAAKHRKVSVLDGCVGVFVTTADGG
jgi:hypothetical protein